MQCPHCFREVNTEGTCPYCGYDAAGDAEKYPLALRPGSILNGRYILGHVLGQGGFGITYIALDYQTKERVAIKEYLPTDFAGRSTGSPSVLVYSGERAENFAYGKAQFLEEARTLAAFIGDSHIVRIYSYFEENGTAYFCMEYVDGLPLDKYMATKGGRLSPEEANRLLLPLMESLEAVHAKGIVHRDIAPDNILVTKDGTAKLIDFGAARYSTGEKSKSLDVILKHGFAPKEQYSRRGRQGPWTDVYALAATYYYAITGKVPPDAVDRIEEDELPLPSALGVRLGDAQEEVLLHALEPSAQHRFQSMGEFRRAMTETGAEAAHRQEEARREQAQREAQERAAREEKERLKRKAAERREREKAAQREAKRQSAAEKEKSKKSKLPLILGAVAVAAVSAMLIITTLILPANRRRESERLLEEKYVSAVTLLQAGKYEDAIAAFEALGDYKDSEARIEEARKAISASVTEAEIIQLTEEEKEKAILDSATTVSAGYYLSACVHDDGTVSVVGEQPKYNDALREASKWKDIASVSATQGFVVGLHRDGTAIMTPFVPAEDGKELNQVNEWENIRQISAGPFHVVGLHFDGTVVSANKHGDLDAVSEWTEIIQVAAGGSHTVGLKEDGTVCAVGSNKFGQCDVASWENIIAISAGDDCTVGLHNDGTVSVAGYVIGDTSECKNWRNIVAVSASASFVVGLKLDGTVVATKPDYVFISDVGQTNVSKWTDIVAVSAGIDHTLGLRADGTVVAAGSSEEKQCNVSEWRDIVIPASGDAHLGVSVSKIYNEIYAQYYGWPMGVYIDGVTPGSCAEKAGIEAGDIITRFDGVEVTSSDELRGAVKRHNAGDSVEIEVYHKEDLCTITVILDQATPD